MEKLAIIFASIVPCLMILILFVVALRKCVPAVTYQEMIACFLLGVFSSIPLLFWDLIFSQWEKSMRYYPVAYVLYGAIILAALPEELSRYVILRWRLSRLSIPVNLMNGLMLGGIVGLGLGTVEHLRYSYLQGWQACGERLFTAVLIHTMAGAIVGFFVGLSIIKRRVLWGVLGISLTILLHSIHNCLMSYFFEFTESSSGDRLYWSIRIFIELTYAVIVVILFRQARRTTPQPNAFQ